MLMQRARPIFLSGLAQERNVRAGFRLDFIAQNGTRPTLLIGGRTFWKVFLDGGLLTAGPARGAHGTLMIDTLPLSGCGDGQTHRIAIEVASQNAPGLQEETGEPGVLIAEVAADGEVLAATGADTAAVRLTQAAAAVEAYSHARPMNELYHLDQSYFAWRMADGTLPGAYPVEELPAADRLLPRDVPLPDLTVHMDARLTGAADIRPDPSADVALFHYETPEKLAAVPEHPSIERAQDVALPFSGRLTQKDDCITVQSDAPFALDFALDRPLAGFVRCRFTVDVDSTLDLVHADRLDERDGTPGARRPDGCNDALRLHCPPGTYDFESFLPYFTRYLRVVLSKGHGLTVHACGVRAFSCGEELRAAFSCADAALCRIFSAAEETYRANAVDVFMDCPDRERGGWLCDGLWTARTERLLTGQTTIDRAMLQRYADRWLVDRSEPGFACCYPSGLDAQMPTWSMFFILQLDEYRRMSGDDALPAALREHVDAFLSFLEAFEDADGFLRDLPGWIFVDWSCANDQSHTQPVSTAVNAMYAAALDAADRLYGRPASAQKAARLRRRLAALADPARFGFFPDVPGGTLFSEACQYYLFWLGVTDPGTSPELFDRLVHEHGPCPDRPPVFPNAGAAEVFIALTVRLEMLARAGRGDALRRELTALFGRMIDRGPGTLWETQGGQSSRCHGFASHAAVWLVRDILGLCPPDAGARQIRICPHPAGLPWARGRIPTPQGDAFLCWAADGHRVSVTVSVPPGYTPQFSLPREWACAPILTVNGRDIPLPEREAFLAPLCPQ